MNLKFKIGDVITSKYLNSEQYIVEEIVVGNDTYAYGKFVFTNCYVVGCSDGSKGYIELNNDLLYCLVSSTESVIKNSSCPKCGGGLVEKYSDWTGDKINKCKSCGWC